MIGQFGTPKGVTLTKGFRLEKSASPFFNPGAECLFSRYSWDWANAGWLCGVIAGGCGPGRGGQGNVATILDFAVARSPKSIIEILLVDGRVDVNCVDGGGLDQKMIEGLELTL